MAPMPGSGAPRGPERGNPTSAILCWTCVVVGAPIRLDYIKDASYEGSVLSVADRDLWALFDEPEVVIVEEPNG